MAADITNMAAFVAGVAGADHCQPIVNWDQIATPKARNAIKA